MNMQTIVKIDNTDVTEYLLEWIVEEDEGNQIPVCNVKLLKTVGNIIPNYRSGVLLEIWRGFVDPFEEKVFSGDIIKINSEHDKDVLLGEDRLHDAIKNGRTKQWDYNVDTQMGIGSEIFKDIADHSKFDYDNTTIINTGTDESKIIKKFRQDGEDDFQKMKELADIYNYVFFYNKETDKIHFQPKGFYTYPTILTVGNQITKNITWVENSHQLCNFVEIYGATVYDTFVETFVGPVTEIELRRTPEDTELRIGGISGTLWERTQRGIQPLTGNTYYIDEDQKKIVLASEQSDIYIKYGAQVPMPVQAINRDSISLHGGPNEIPHYKKIVLNNIKDVDDAITRAKDYIKRYSTPFLSLNEIPISNETIKNEFIQIGSFIVVDDPSKNRSATLLVNHIRKKWPHVNDLISCGDKAWRTENWQTEISEKINKLFYELTKNQEYLIILKVYSKNILIEKSDLIKSKRYLICDSFTLDHHENGILDQGIILDEFEGLIGEWSSVDLTIDKDVEHIHNTESLQCIQTTSEGTVTKTFSSAIDASEYVDVITGVANRGTIGLWVFINTDEDTYITEIKLTLESTPGNTVELIAKAYKNKIGYHNWPPTALEFQEGWNYLLFFLKDGAYTGTFDWSNINKYTLKCTASDNVTYNYDYLTISKSNYIGLNGLDRRVMEIPNE